MSSHTPAGERLYRALVILVVGAFTAATAGLIAAIALISRRLPLARLTLRNNDRSAGGVDVRAHVHGRRGTH